MESPVPFVIEVSYEIVHKVGGVETVVRSKVPEMIRQYGQNFLMCGPYIPADDRYSTLFEDQRKEHPLYDQLLAEFERDFELPENFIKFGTWLIPGGPKVILLPVDLPGGAIQQVRAKAIETLNVKLNMDLDQIPWDKGGEQFKRNAINFGVLQWCLFSFLMPKFIQKRPQKTTLIVQVHEWLASMGLILFKEGNTYFKMGRQCDYWNNEQIKFVFTTHATTIGRHLSAGDACLNDIFKLNPGADFSDGEAVKRSVALEHRAERCAATAADLLTTVSTITNEECKHFLGRSADIITWNGLDVNSQKGLVDDHELQSTHRVNKQKIYDFIQTYFCGIDTQNCQIFFTAGRNEYKNKGLDLFIDSLAKVRDCIDNPDFIRNNPEIGSKTVVAFIVAPQGHRGFTQHVLNCMNLAKEMKLAIEVMCRTIETSLVNNICSPNNVDLKKLTLDKLVGAEDTITLKRFQQTLKKSTLNAPITTHNIEDENCPILGHLRGKGLINQPFTRVKVIFVPEFLSKTSVFGLDYQDFVRGAHLGVFSSLYEPFGYTSPECMCVGTASVLSNLCGFGNLVEQINEQMNKSGKDLIRQMEEIHRSSSLNVLNAAGVDRSALPQQKPASEKNTWTDNHFGVQVVDRVFKGYWESVDEQTKGMLDYLKLSTFDRIAMRNRMARNAVFVDWSVQAREYIRAYDMVIHK